MKSLVETAADIVNAQASHTKMSADEMAGALGKVMEALCRAKAMEGAVIEAGESKPTPRQRSIFRNHVICLECGAKLKQLSRHLTQHGLDKKSYKAKYGIPRAQKLVATSLTERRRQIAEERGLAGKLAEARAKRAPKVKKVAKVAVAAEEKA